MKKKASLFTTLLFTLIILGACSNDTNEEQASDDVLITLAGDTVSKTGGCVLANQFAAGDDIIFRMNATDAATGEQLKEADLKVHLSTGEVLDMVYGPHGDEFFWVINYPVTDETPKGKLDYHVTAEFEGADAEFKPFNIEPSLLTIVDASATTEATPAEEGPAEDEVDLSTVEVDQTIDLIGKNFTFTNAAGEDTFYVKVGEEVTINYTDEDGVHGFDIDEFDISLKEPGTVKFTPETAGEYKIACNIFCGVDHDIMTSKLVVVE